MKSLGDLLFDSVPPILSFVIRNSKVIVYLFSCKAQTYRL